LTVLFITSWRGDKRCIYYQCHTLAGLKQWLKRGLNLEPSLGGQASQPHGVWDH
jgi:hypothetical protein